MAKYSKAQGTAVKKYKEKNDLVQMRIWVPREEKESYERAAVAEGKSLTQYVRDRLKISDTQQ